MQVTLEGPFLSTKCQRRLYKREQWILYLNKARSIFTLPLIVGTQNHHSFLYLQYPHQHPSHQGPCCCLQAKAHLPLANQEVYLPLVLSPILPQHSGMGYLHHCSASFLLPQVLQASSLRTMGEF